MKKKNYFYSWQNKDESVKIELIREEETDRKRRGLRVSHIHQAMMRLQKISDFLIECKYIYIVQFSVNMLSVI